MMKIALTGTPGTGKTEVSKVLAEKGYEIIDLNKLIFENKWDLGFDDDYQSTVADLAKLNAFVSEYPEDGKLHIFEGHLSHLLDLDTAVVLRTRPGVLEKRLKERDFPELKIRENVEAEALAVITTEAIGHFEDIYEVDTTELSVEETAELIEKILTDPDCAKQYAPGKFNWLEEFV
jgi:adenylate kinase